MILPKMLPLKVLIWVNKHPFWKYKHLTEELRMYLLLVETVTNFIFLDSKITALDDCSHKTKRCSLLGRKAMTNLDSVLKSKDITLPTEVHIVKTMIFPVVLHRCESWTIRRLSAKELMLSNCGAGEDSWESLGQQGDPTFNPKGNQLWIFIEKTDAEAEAPVLWPPDVKSQLTRKDTDAGKDWRQEKRVTEDEMVGWHHWLNGHEFDQASEDSEGQGSLPCCSSWGCKGLDKP